EDGVTTLDVSQNAILMANATVSTSPMSIFLSNNDGMLVSQNSAIGGSVGVNITSAGSNSGNVVTQNLIGSCGAQGVLLSNAAGSAIQVSSNQFGECGLQDIGILPSNAVVYVNGNSASGASTFVQNNQYTGHANGLSFYISSAFHIPAANTT